MTYLNAFLCGGLLCAVGQILIDRTQLTPARILTGYVVAGVVLSAVGLYAPLAEFAGAGASVPLLGFGHLLAKGVRTAVAEKGAIGILTLMVKAGLAASNGEARRLVVQGGVLVDGEKVGAPTVSFTADQLKNGIVIKKGKKVYHKVSL